MNSQEQILRKMLKANAVFSFMSGVSLIIFAKSLAKMMHIANRNVLIFIGIALLFFVALLLYNAFKMKIKPLEIKIIIVQDCLWGIGSIILIVFNPFHISFYGKITILIIALIVMFFAISQSNALLNWQRILKK